MAKKDPYHEAIKAAKNATRARIREDRKRAPEALKRLFDVIGSDLFDSLFNATRAWRTARLNDRDMGEAFKATTETTLACYIADRRLDAARVLRLTTGLKLPKIAEKVGFATYRTFSNNYKLVKQKPPSEGRQLLPPPVIDLETGLLGLHGLLDGDKLVPFFEDLLKIYPSDADRVLDALGVAKPKPLIIVNGARTDRLDAEDLWHEIRDLPLKEQCQRVRGHLFHSEVFFDLLREKSKLEGRKCRRRGVELAELMLVSLEKSAEVFGERIHDLRALAWAWIGNAHRLALDFLAAAGAFQQAEREWSTPRAKRDLSIQATIFALKGSLRLVRREYAAATEDLDRSISQFREFDQPRDVARELITRATIHIYAGKLGDAVDDLHEAARLIDEEEEKELAYWIRINLAKALARAGHARSAATELDRARQLNQAIDMPLAAIELDCTAGDLAVLQGDIEAAKRLYLAGLAGYREAGEQMYFGIVAVDVMVVYATQDDWGNVVSLAAEAVPILVLQELHDETLAVVKLLAKALKTRDITRRLLTDLQAALRQDPLAMM